MPGRSSGEIRFDHLTAEDGLSQQSVETILQDRFGFMWFGTSDGLNLYDGYTMKVFQADSRDPASLTDSWVTALYEDLQGALWVGTFGAGLNRLNEDRKTFTHFSLISDHLPQGMGQNKIVGFTEERDGTLWVATENTGIFLIRGEEISQLVHDPDDPRSLASNEIRDLYRDGNDVIWVATREGLHRYDGRGFRVFRHDPENPGSLPSDFITAITGGRDGDLWIGTSEHGLARLDMQTERVTRYRHDPGDPHALGSDRIYDLLVDVAGTLWVATNDGLNRFLPEESWFERFVHDPNEPASIGHSFLLSLYQDRGGVLWMGTYGNGVSKFNASVQGFRYYRESPDKPENGPRGKIIFAFFEDSRNKIWIGTLQAGVNIFDPVADTFRQLKHDPAEPTSLSNNLVYTIQQDRRGDLWVGTQRGLNRYLPEIDGFERFMQNEADENGLQSGIVVYLYEDRDNRFWIGTLDAGLALMDRDKKTFTHFTFDPENENSISNNFVNTILQDLQGRIWAGTDMGLSRLERDGETFTKFIHDPENPVSLSHNSVMCLYQRREGELWIGTYGGGLNRLDMETGVFTTFNQTDGLPNNSIYGILEDRDGNFWISTNQGLCQFNPERGRGSIRVFNTGNVLYHNEFNRGAFMERANGEMFFGGKGFYRFLPTEIQVNRHVPPVVLTSFRKFNQDVSLDVPLPEMKSIELAHDDSVISFSFAAMDFTSPSQNRFRYKMENLYETWIELKDDNDITYTNLSPGRYTLMVEGSNNDGVWNPRPLELAIRVKPPVWAAWYAFTFYGLFLAAMIIAFARYRQVEKRKELERAYAEGKAQFASTVLHNIGNVLNSLRVSCDQGRRLLKESKIEQLVKAHSLMKENLDDLPDFLTNDRRGKLLPGYFISAGELLREEHKELSDEFREMGDKIHLMRDIIESQQAHAKQELIAESHDLNTLVEEALRVFIDTLERYHVKVTKKLTPLPPVKAERGHLVHAIINLAKNGVESMIGTRQDFRELILETGRLDTHRAYLSISDCGEGIAEEVLPKIFTYGFTTKEDGHGFGLHSCAKSIRDMGGTIRVESDGPGKGATFVISLSFANPD